MRAFYMRSDDDGRTFSKPVEITSAFDAFRPEYPWKVLATGPGHGIQLRTGRLIVPVWVSTGTGTEDWIFPNETAGVELADGRVMLNIRTESKAQRRLIVYSKDGAAKWTRPEFQEQLPEPICFASMVRLSLGQRNRLLFVNPGNLERSDGKSVPGSSRDRRNLTIGLSYDEGTSWPVKKIVEPGPSGYSDLAVLPGGDILCFYEKGTSQEGKPGGVSGWRSESLTLARCNLEWLTGGKDSMKKKRGR